MTIQALEPQPHLEAPGEPLTILIVEDDPAIGDLLGEVVAEVPGWRAAVAGNAQEAIAVLRRVAADVFLFDVNLPGPSGPELLAWLRGEPANAGVPAVLMSAAGRGPQVRAALQGGQAMAFLQKPFDLDELLAVLHRAVQSIPGRRASAGRGARRPASLAGACRTARGCNRLRRWRCRARWPDRPPRPRSAPRLRRRATRPAGSADAGAGSGASRASTDGPPALRRRRRRPARARPPGWPRPAASSVRG